MTTDVKTEPETETQVTKTEEQKTVVENPNDKFLSEMKSMFETSIKELKDTFEQKKQELDETIKQKDEEINKLKQMNANLALTGNFGKANNGQPDYSSADFDEIDQSIWDEQAKSALDSIDKKIFDIKSKEN